MNSQEAIFREVMQTQYNHQYDKATALLICGHRLTFVPDHKIHGRKRMNNEGRIVIYLECFLCEEVDNK